MYMCCFCSFNYFILRAAFLEIFNSIRVIFIDECHSVIIVGAAGLDHKGGNIHRLILIIHGWHGIWFCILLIGIGAGIARA